MKDISDLVHEAVKTDSKGFLRLIDNADQLLSEEIRRSGKLQIIGRLVHLPPEGEAMVIGDIHGDVDSLEYILKETRFLERASREEETFMIFLGDYGDRGPYSTEVYHVILSLKRMFPDRVILMQGNHEGPEDLLASPHDLPYHLLRKFGGEGRIVYENLSRLFRRFYTAVLVEERFIMLHGGVPSEARTIDDIAYAYEKHPNETHLEEILWSDPAERIIGTYPSPRGAGKLFGRDVTKRFLEMLGVRLLIRGHEPVDEGYRINHLGMVLTLFSRKGPPYYNSHGAYLEVDLYQVEDSARHLEPFIHKF